MKNPRVILSLIALTVISTLGAQAQATRTWISGVGDDANPCSRTAPCKTFAGAISKTAAGGEIDALDPGGFGGVTITKSITLDGGGGQVASILVPGTNGVTITAGPNDVITLRNLSIQGLGTGLDGVKVNSAYALHVEHCSIAGFENGVDVLLSTGGQIFIDESVVHDNSGNGLNVLATGTNVHTSISNSHFSNNSNGIFSGDFSRTTVRNSDASGNVNAGFTALGNGGSATLSITDSVATNNLGTGVVSGGGGALSSVRVSNVTLYGNTVGFATSTNGTITSFGNNHNSGSGAPTTTVPPQ